MNGYGIKNSVVFIALLLFFTGCDRDSGKDSWSGDGEKNTMELLAPEQRMKMPDFVLPSIQNGTDVNSVTLQGRVVLLAFFTPWCSSCVTDMAMLQKIQNDYDTNEFMAIGMAVIGELAGSGLEQFTSRLALDFPVLVSDKAVRQGFGGIITVPTVFLIDQHGRIVKKHVSNL